MKKIGEGWQYNVYDIGNNRVLKRYNSFFKSYLIMLKDAFINMRLPVINFKKLYNEGKTSAVRSLKIILDCTLDKNIFGNPKIVGTLDYEQDIMIPLSVFFKSSTVEKGQDIIDEFIDFNKFLVKNKIIEKNFNIADNFGLNNLGNITLIDIGEICTDEQEINKSIKKRVWSARDVTNRLPFDLREYYIKKMDKAFLYENNISTVADR